MLKKFNRFVNYQVMVSIIFMILGIFFVINPDVSFKTISYLVGILLLINGVFLFVIDMKLEKFMIFADNLVLSIMSILFGIVILCYPSIIGIIVPIVLGVWMICLSMFKLRISMILKSDNISSWLLSFILSILSIACGIILIIRPMESVVMIIFITGCVLIVQSIADIIDMIIFKKNMNYIGKKIKKNMKILDME